jgi:NAD(P)-dependent dehydrogenase (short-subunit alcohol dehydrogenase family)
MSRLVIITGGSRGIGAATARLAAAAGYHVALTYRTRGDAAAAVVEAIAQAGGHAEAFQADVSRESDVVRLFQQVDARFGAPSGLVNNVPPRRSRRRDRECLVDGRRDRFAQ